MQMWRLRKLVRFISRELPEIHRRHGNESSRWAFGAEWADDWLKRAQRLSAHPVRQVAVLVGDATGGSLDLDSPAIRSFELFCARSGVEVLSLSVRATNDIS